MKRVISMSAVAAVFAAALLALSCSAQKTVVILGDSYSTFAGYVPEGNALICCLR